MMRQSLRPTTLPSPLGLCPPPLPTSTSTSPFAFPYRRIRGSSATLPPLFGFGHRNQGNHHPVLLYCPFFSPILSFLGRRRRTGRRTHATVEGRYGQTVGGNPSLPVNRFDDMGRGREWGREGGRRGRRAGSRRHTTLTTSHSVALPFPHDTRRAWRGAGGGKKCANDATKPDGPVLWVE